MSFLAFDGWARYHTKNSAKNKLQKSTPKHRIHQTTQSPRRGHFKYPSFFSWGRGSGGVKSAGVSQSVRETGRDESQSVPSPENSSKQGIWSSQIFRDLSQVVRRTPRDTPVHLYTQTSPGQIFRFDMRP